VKVLRENHEILVFFQIALISENVINRNTGNTGQGIQDMEIME
jgi:hypothetical protein